jgi:diguanylate cyclase (GGDEF)-like protein
LRAQESLVASELSMECDRVDALSGMLRAAVAGASSAQVQDALQDVVGYGVDYAEVTLADGSRTSVGSLPAVAGDLQSCTGAPTGAVIAGVSTGGRTSRSSESSVRAVVAQTVTSAALAEAARDADGVGDAVLLVDGRPVAASFPLAAAGLTRARAEAAAALASPGASVRSGDRLVLSAPLRAGSRALVLVTRPAPGWAGTVAATTGLALALAVLAVVLPWRVTRERERAAVALAAEALERSRAEAREGLEHLGEALSVTHDLEGLVGVVLESAVAAVGADGGLAYVAEGEGALPLVAAHAVDEPPLDGQDPGPDARGGAVAPDGLVAPPARRVVPGTGLLGGVAATGSTLRGRLGSRPGELPPAPGDPERGWLLAVPLRGSAGVAGVLALLRRPSAAGFSAEEAEEVRALAQHAGIALDNVLLHRETQRLAITDPLTGLWNFRYLSLSLGREVERATRFGRHVALLMIDVDHFKAVNDTHGHGRGDAVLRELVLRIGHQVREVDVLARYGGEEFVLVLPETSAEGAVRLAERIRQGVASPPFGVGGAEVPLRVTVSIGVAAFPVHASSPAQLLQAADEALYEAKHAGRNRWAVAPMREDVRDPVRPAPTDA